MEANAGCQPGRANQPSMDAPSQRLTPPKLVPQTHDVCCPFYSLFRRCAGQAR